jgi:transcriptional regulator with XRE-family HTH domain
MTDATTPTRPSQRWTATLDGRRLRRLRRQHHLTQDQLATKAGISTGTVARLERTPRINCQSRTLGRLATALGEPPTALTPAEPG